MTEPQTSSQDILNSVHKNQDQLVQLDNTGHFNSGMEIDDNTCEGTTLHDYISSYETILDSDTNNRMIKRVAE